MSPQKDATTRRDSKSSASRRSPSFTPNGVHPSAFSALAPPPEPVFLPHLPLFLPPGSPPFQPGTQVSIPGMLPLVAGHPYQLPPGAPFPPYAPPPSPVPPASNVVFVPSQHRSNPIFLPFPIPMPLPMPSAPPAISSPPLIIPPAPQPQPYPPPAAPPAPSATQEVATILLLMDRFGPNRPRDPPPENDANRVATILEREMKKLDDQRNKRREERRLKREEKKKELEAKMLQDTMKMMLEEKQKEEAKAHDSMDAAGMQAMTTVGSPPRRWAMETELPEDGGQLPKSEKAPEPEPEPSPLQPGWDVPYGDEGVPFNFDEPRSSRCTCCRCCCLLLVIGIACPVILYLVSPSTIDKILEFISKST